MPVTQYLKRGVQYSSFNYIEASSVPDSTMVPLSTTELVNLFSLYSTPFKPFPLDYKPQTQSVCRSRWTPPPLFYRRLVLISNLLSSVAQYSQLPIYNSIFLPDPSHYPVSHKHISQISLNPLPLLLIYHHIPHGFSPPPFLSDSILPKFP